MIFKRIAICYALSCFVLTVYGAYSYPLGATASGVIDVTNLPSFLTTAGFANLDKTGTTDNRARLQALVDRFKTQSSTNPNLEVRILYFPNGTYRLSGGITGVAATPGGGGILFQGQSRTGTILRLDNNASGFNDPTEPQQVLSFFDDVWTNNAFYNGIESLTVDTGSGNSGAVGISFVSNNTGYVRDVLIQTGSNGTAPGFAGLLLNKEISDPNPSGTNLVKGVSVKGFQYGVHCGTALQQGFTLEQIELSGQSVAGIRIENNAASIRKVTSTNSVPAIQISGMSSHVIVLDSVFNGGVSGNAAIDLSEGTLFVRDSVESGYGAILNDGGVAVTADLSDTEYMSTGSQVLKLWASTVEKTLDLPIAETPEVPWDTQGSDWYIVDPTLQNDDTAALRAAFESGASTICILPDDDGAIQVSSTLTIGPNVRRIIGQWNEIQPSGYLYHSNPGLPIFKFATSNHPAVVIEKFRSPFFGDRKAYFIRNESSSDLVLRDIFYVAGPLYRSFGEATGRLFIEDVHLLPGSQLDDVENQETGILVTRQEAYMRQVNPEMFYPGILNDGGTVWIMGFKVGESTGPVVRSINGATTEILGGIMNMTHDVAPGNAAESVILEIENSNVSAILFERFEGVGTSGGLGWGKNAYAVAETRGSETRRLENTAAAGVPRRPGQLGALFPLFVGYQIGVGIDAISSTVLDTAGTVNGFSIHRGDADTSAALTITYTVSGTAVSGTHYQPLSGTVVIPAGDTEVILPVTLIDNEPEGLTHTLILRLESGTGYELGQVSSATLSIIENAYVVVDGPHQVLPADTAADVLVTLNNPTADAQTVNVIAPSMTNYTFQTSDDPGGPEFQWVDISQSGFKILDNSDDGSSTNRPIGFSFPYYGQTFTHLLVSPNGYLDFDDEQGLTWLNEDLRTVKAGMGNRIAPMWDDHNPSAANSDAVYYQTVDADTFIVQWNNLLPYGNNQGKNLVTFQVVLKSDGTIYFYYLQMNSEENTYSYTSGLTNADQSKTVLLSFREGANSYNPDFAHPLMAVRFNPLGSWFSSSASLVNVPPFGSETLFFHYDSGPLDGALEQYDVDFVFSDPTIGTITQPVSLSITNLDPPVASNLSLIGAGQVGKDLTVSYTYQDDEGDPEGATVVEWLRASSVSGLFNPVATSSSYSIQPGDAGHYFKARVTPASINAPYLGAPVTSTALGPIGTSGSISGLPGGLVAYWAFDGTTQPVRDLSGFNRDLTLQTGASIYPLGKFGQALKLTGGGATGATDHFITDEFTICTWVYHDGAYTTSGNEIILSKGWDFYLGIDTSTADGKLRMQIKHSGGIVSNAHLDDAKTLIPPNTWTHLAVKRESGIFTFYVNGVERNPNYTTAVTTASSDVNAVALALGINPLNSSTWWRGKLDETQMYSRALSAAEIAGLSSRVVNVYENWREEVFHELPAGALDPDAADSANPDSDPYVNLIEFAFGLDPNSHDVSTYSPSWVKVTHQGQDYMGLEFRRRKGVSTGTTETGYQVDGIRYTVQYSPGLQPADWQTESLLFSEVSIENNLDGTETVTVRLTEAMNTTDKAFLRLAVEPE